MGSAPGTGWTSYDYCLESRTPTLVSNNSFAAGSIGMIEMYAESIVSGNDFTPADGQTITTYVLITEPSKVINNTFTGTSTAPIAQYLFAQGASSTISGNTFSPPVAGSSHIRLSDCQCIVTDNRFVRDGTAIQNYITVSGTSGHQITNNYFDSSTTDGVTETIISNVTDGNIVHSNKNQVGYITIFPQEVPNGTSFSYIIPAASGVGTHNVQQDMFTGSPFGLYYARGDLYTINSGAGVLQKVVYLANLSRVLPLNAKVVGSLIGFRLNNIGANLSSSNFSIESSLHKTAAAFPISNPYSSPASTLASVNGSFPNFLDPAINQQSTAYTPDTNTRYLTADYTGNNVYINNTQDVILRFQINFILTASSANTSYHLSTFLIKYVLA